MKTESVNKSATVRTRRAIVKLLKQEGSMDALALASRLNITAMAVRQHLYALQEEQLVTYQEEQRSMGRPAKLWQLTPPADRLFPEGYAELTVSLLHSMREAFGEEGLDRLLEIRTRQQIAEYREKVSSDGSLQQRLEALAAKRTNEGYMAQIQPLEDGSFLLIENHCPICAAAVACTGLCRKELEVFQTVLGQNTVIERTEHIVAGERRCVYRVRASQ
ncbi:helix-turn-helix transcriptional regulator [Scytonema sp. PCC 10023]|uniref:helix-turn-helix transcriptional regulator n=1 Tax=Scytonema sp. PCC 10023 TaxID=1680591 RepID=UPI0039C6572E